MGWDLFLGECVVSERELEWRFSRSSGAGGQHVNTSSTRVELRFAPGLSQALDESQKDRLAQHLQLVSPDAVVSVVVSERRSQWQNRVVAHERLAGLLCAALAQHEVERIATEPRPTAKAGRLDEKRKRAVIKQFRQRPTSDE